MIFKSERNFKKTGEKLDFMKYDNLEFREIIRVVKEGLETGLTDI